MALPFVPSDAAMLAVQAAIVAAPGADRPGLDWLRRLGGKGWALLSVASVVVVIFAIRGVAQTATGLTLALVAVPILAALALGWGMRGARPRQPWPFSRCSRLPGSGVSPSPARSTIRCRSPDRALIDHHLRSPYQPNSFTT